VPRHCFTGILVHGRVSAGVLDEVHLVVSGLEGREDFDKALWKQLARSPKL
jgi:hypothetical protein